MLEGVDVFNPGMYSEQDGHISAIQKLLEIRHSIGEDAFSSEYQMKPQSVQLQLELPTKLV